MSASETTFSTVLAGCVHDAKNNLFDALAALTDAESLLPAEAVDTRGKLHLARSEMERVNRKLIDLLTLYKSENGLFGVVPDSVPLADFLDDTCLDARELLAATPHLHFTASSELAPGAVWAFDRQRIAEVISQAIGNARRYARSRIVLRIRMSGNACLEFDIADDGPGFAATAGTSGSTGIGLIVGRLVVAAHTRQGRHGELITGNDAELGGARVTVRLP